MMGNISMKNGKTLPLYFPDPLWEVSPWKIVNLSKVVLHRSMMGHISLKIKMRNISVKNGKPCNSCVSKLPDEKYLPEKWETIVDRWWISS
jgi:hypothetical protein